MFTTGEICYDEGALQLHIVKNKENQRLYLALTVDNDGTIATHYFTYEGAISFTEAIVTALERMKVANGGE